MPNIPYQVHPFPWRLTLSRSTLAFMPHFHEDVELVYCHAGHSTVLIDRNEYTLSAGELLTVFPYQVHGYRNDENLSRDLLIFSPELVPAFREQLVSSIPQNPVFCGADQIPELYQLLQLTNSLQHTENPWRQDIVSAYLTAFIGLLLPKLSLSPISGHEWSSAHSVLLYCSSHYREPLTITALSSELHMHQSYISHLFSDRLKVRFNDYINSLRLRDARHLLRSTSITVTDIASQVGFDTIRTFNRVFLRTVGMTPTEYRDISKRK